MFSHEVVVKIFASLTYVSDLVAVQYSTVQLKSSKTVNLLPWSCTSSVD